jgi:hypothetical protein
MTRRLLNLLTVVLAFVLGCDNPSDTAGPTERRTSTATATTDTSRPTAPPISTTIATRPSLKPIEMRDGVHLARIEHRITVSSDGNLRSVRTDNKSYSGNDIDPRHERVEIREGQLTPEQVADLAALFANWDSLSPERYNGVPDGRDVSIRYGDKTVSGGSAVPKQVTDARVRLMQVARSMPFVKQ